MAFIKVTIKEDGSPVWVNVDQIQAIVPHEDHTVLPLANNGGEFESSYDVIESASAILAAIADASGGAVDEVAVTEDMLRTASAAYRSRAACTVHLEAMHLAIKAAFALRARRQP